VGRIIPFSSGDLVSEGSICILMVSHAAERPSGKGARPADEGGLVGGTHPADGIIHLSNGGSHATVWAIYRAWGLDLKWRVGWCGEQDLLM
jgi:hypothetical protein